MMDKYIPYSSTISVQAILGNNDLTLEEKAQKIHSYDFKMACLCSDGPGVKASMSMQAVLDVLIERESTE